jgi:hypothetical protein
VLDKNSSNFAKPEQPLHPVILRIFFMPKASAQVHVKLFCYASVSDGSCMGFHFWEISLSFSVSAM